MKIKESFMQQRVFITHGYTAHSQKHWFPWLKVRLEKKNVCVKVLDMPNSSQPKPEEWLAHHQAEIPEIHETDIFIAHSLGCIATLRFLAQQNQKIAGLILVAGFDQAVSNLPELDAFTAEKLDYSQLIANSSQRTVIASKDDEVIQHELSEQLAVNLKAKYFVTNGYNHFTERFGVTELPLVLDEVLSML